MTPVTLEAIEAKQTEISNMIAQLKAAAQASTLLRIPEADIELAHGERYVGAVLNEAGQIEHHLVLMAARPTEKMEWQDAMDWAATLGGDLPTRQEQALLFANCRPHLQPEWHWSCETHADNASYAWGCLFSNGYQYFSRKSYEGSAVAVRRIR